MLGMAPAFPEVLVDARFRERKRGGDRCRYELASMLARQKRVRCAFLTYPGGAEELGPFRRGHGDVLCPYYPEEHPRADVFEHLMIPRIARSLGVSIYHGTFNVLPCFRAASVNVVTIHDMAVFAMPEAYSRKFGALMRLVIRLGIRHADRLIAVSNATRDEIERLFPGSAGKTVGIHNGVGEEFIRAYDLAERSVDDALAMIGVCRPYVLFVGNIERKKNLSRLAEAFLRLKRNTTVSHSLVVCGEKPTSLPGCSFPREALAEGSPVTFTGYVPDNLLPALYRGADLLAYPSLYEGFGMPVLEAMAAGVPVLTSSVSSLPEVAGGAAWLVNPYEVEDIERGLEESLSNEAWRIRAVQRGRMWALQMTWDANGRNTLALYQTLLRKGECEEP